MMQGDSYWYGIRLRNNAKNPVTPSDVKDIEITIGHLRKTYLNAELLYSDGRWLFFLSQKNTFGFAPRLLKVQVRVAWANGAIEGHDVYGFRIKEHIGKELL